MWRRALPVLLSQLLGTVTGLAQQYDLRNFSLEQGLPSATVNAICEDHEGFLWVGTDQGAARGQGLRFETFDRRHGLPGEEVNALVCTADERVWAGLRNGQVAWWQNGHFTAWKSDQPLPVHPVRTLLSGPQGSLWLASRGGGIWRLDTAARKAVPLSEGLTSMRVNGLVRLTDQRLLAATDSGLAVLVGTRWQMLAVNADLPDQRVLSIHADSVGVLVGTSKGYLELDGQLQPLPIAERFTGYQPIILPHPVVLAILRGTQNDLWLGTPAGLVHFTKHGGTPRMTVIAEANGLGHDLVRCIHVDRSGGIWAGTGFGGVSKFTSDAFIYFNERDGLPSRIVSGILRTADGLIYMATMGGGLAMWDGVELHTYGRAEGLPSLFVTCLAEDEEGYLLLGTALHGLHRLRGERIEPVLSVGVLETDRIHAIQRGTDGRLWVGTASGLYMDPGTGTFQLLGSDTRAVNAVVPTADTVWMATDSGLYVVPLRAASLVPQPHRVMPAVKAIALARDSQGSLWVGTASDGVYRVQGSRLEQYGLADGLQSLTVEQVLLDAYENLWLGTRRGIHHLELDVMQEQVLDITAYGPDDGFIGIESIRNAALLDRDSTLWFGTVRGAIRFDPRKVVEDPREPLVHLTEMQLFYERPDWTPWCHGMGRNGLPTDLELPYDKNHLTFEFTGISLAYPEKVRYRWILEGYDPDWSPITATQRVTYSNIPPGTYTFRVMARNASGIWNEHPVSYAFTIAPPFWETTTFRVAGGAGVFLLLFGFVRIRERNGRLDRERLEATVARRTTELASERDRSDALLLNILPASTAEELKTKGRADARRYEHCTVLFSDFKGFTSFSSRMDSDTLVAELDHYFRLFDQLCEEHGIEKIKTIGDAYMCAAGIPEPSATHALNAVLMALGMLRAVAQSNAEREAKGLQTWPVRIGLHSGPVVAGVVGQKKFAYDIWGDTVNLASRMESNGEAGHLNISGPVYAQVMDYVETVPRGPIQVKGKGQVQMYFVLRLKPEWSADEEGLIANEALLARCTR